MPPPPPPPPPSECQQRPEGHVAVLDVDFGSEAYTAWSFLGGHANTEDPAVWANIPEAVKATLAARSWPSEGSGPAGTMRLGKIARMSDGTWVDLEVFVLDQYHPGNSNNNRLKIVDGGSPFGVINLHQPKDRGDPSERSRFRFQLYAHSDACGGTGEGGSDFSTWDAGSCNTPITVAPTPTLTLTLILTLTLALALALALALTLALALALALTLTSWRTTPSPSSMSTRSGRSTACARSRRSPCGARRGTPSPVRSPTSRSRPTGDQPRPGRLARPDLPGRLG